MDSLMGFTQMVFIKSKNIYDGWISALDVVDLMKRNKSGIILKLDFKKAYDRVNWDIFWFIMGRMVFDDHWIKWIVLRFSE